MLTQLALEVANHDTEINRSIEGIGLGSNAQVGDASISWYGHQFVVQDGGKTFYV